MRGQFERRLARIESRSGDRKSLSTFNDEELATFTAIARKYLGRDPTREDIRARDGFMYRIADDEEMVIVDAVKAAVKRGSVLTGL